MGDINVPGELSGPLARARLSVRILVRCRERVFSHLYIGSFSYVRANVRFSSRITVRQG